VDLAWYTFTALYCAFALGWLLLGLAAALTAHVSAVHYWASAAAVGGHGPGWRRVGAGLLHGGNASYPPVDVILDYAFSAVSLLFAAILFRLARRDWTVRFLIIGVLGSAGAFNLQAHTSIDAMSTMTGVGIDLWHVALLHGVGGVAYVFALLLFPTGTLDWGGGRSWPLRVLLVTSVAGAAALLSVSAADTPHTISFVLFFGLLTPIAGVTAQLVRYRRATSAEARQQSRVLLWALGLSFSAALVLALISATLPTPVMPKSALGLGSDFSVFSGLGPQTAVVFWVFRAVFAMIPFAIMAGVLRFRLWDVERLFNRTLTYGVLIAMIGVVYVVGVVLTESVLGLHPRLVSTPQIVASGLIALAFQPVRIRVSRWADRLVYGKRQPVYDVLAQVPALAQASEPGAAALGSLARIVAEGLAVGSASVLLDLPGGVRGTYRWPAGNPGPAVAEHRIPVSYRGEHVGALSLPSSEERRLPPDRRGLLGDLSGSVGVILHNASLSIQLEHSLREVEARSAELRASRWRIVAAQDSERRELERDLHDGAQPGLTAVRVTLGLASHLGQAGDPAGAQQVLTQLQGQITDALDGLRETLRGLDPQIASVAGLVAALREQAAVLGARPEFQVTAGPTAGEDTVGEDTAGRDTAGRDTAGRDTAGRDTAGRDTVLDPVVGAAVYFCCTEALQNTVKHCPGAPVAVQLTVDALAGRLRFRVADSGPGFELAAVPDGGGLQNMADRISAVGGDLVVRPELGKGTEVTGWIPVALSRPEPAGQPAEKA
jgi:signal transduction histidine kinase